MKSVNESSLGPRERFELRKKSMCNYLKHRLTNPPGRTILARYDYIVQNNKPAIPHNKPEQISKPNPATTYSFRNRTMMNYVSKTKPSIPSNKREVNSTILVRHDYNGQKN